MRRASARALVGSLTFCVLIAALPPRVPAQPAPAPAAEPATFTRGAFKGRAFRLFVPATRAIDAARPLLVGLHGCWQTPEEFAVATRLNEHAERRGLVVVYPAQSRRDNPYRCWNWFDPRNQSATGDEPAAVLALAAMVREQRGIRAPRLIVLGISAGGFMAVNLACVAPDRVAGVGVTAAGPFRCGVGAEAAIRCMRGAARNGAVAAEECLAAAGGTAPAVRASLWHGAADTVVSPVNLTNLESMFARVRHATAAATESREGAVVAVHRDARRMPVVEAWLVRGMGHAWSGGDPRAPHTYPAGPEATERMLEFLLAGGVR